MSEPLYADHGADRQYRSEIVGYASSAESDVRAVLLHDGELFSVPLEALSRVSRTPHSLTSPPRTLISSMTPQQESDVATKAQVERYWSE